MKSEGKTQEEIDSYLEDWALTLNIWGSDEKPLRARELRNKNKK